jgi:ATP-dependent Lon protease
MEIIEVNGYTVEEKIEIAKQHLLPKQREQHGLKAKDIALKPAIIEKIVEDYTRESGVRSLEKKIGALVLKKFLVPRSLTRTCMKAMKWQVW